MSSNPAIRESFFFTFPCILRKFRVGNLFNGVDDCTENSFWSLPKEGEKERKQKSPPRLPSTPPSRLHFQRNQICLKLFCSFFHFSRWVRVLLPTRFLRAASSFFELICDWSRGIWSRLTSERPDSCQTIPRWEDDGSESSDGNQLGRRQSASTSCLRLQLASTTAIQINFNSRLYVGISDSHEAGSISASLRSIRSIRGIRGIRVGARYKTLTWEQPGAIPVVSSPPNQTWRLLEFDIPETTATRPTKTSFNIRISNNNENHRHQSHSTENNK